VSINNDDPNVFAFLRKSGEETLVVVLNMSAKPHKINFELESKGIHGSKLVPLYYSSKFSSDGFARIQLEPFGAFVAKVQ
jgi:hypothetical protein